MNNPVGWFEIYVQDMERARAFYETVFLAPERRLFNFRYASAAHCLQVFRDYYGPTQKAFARLDSAGQAALERDFIALMERFNIAGPSSLVVPSAYLEAVITKRCG